MLLTLWTIWQFIKVYFGVRVYKWAKHKYSIRKVNI